MTRETEYGKSPYDDCRCLYLSSETLTMRPMSYDCASPCVPNHEPRYHIAAVANYNEIQCDGNQPCSACAKRQTTCRYSPHAPSRGFCIDQKLSAASKRSHIFRSVDTGWFTSGTPQESALELPSQGTPCGIRASTYDHRQIAPLNPTQCMEVGTRRKKCTKTKDASCDISRLGPVAVEPRFLRDPLGNFCKYNYIAESMF